jgi:hypothetical protein
VRGAHESSERSSNTVRDGAAEHAIHWVLDLLDASQALTANDEDDVDRRRKADRANRAEPDIDQKDA